MNKPGLRVLVVPLDWGLGHATRCIPIINELENLGYTVILAGEGPTKYLLENAFAHLKTRVLKGYRLRYHANPLLVFPSLLLQIPGAIHRKNTENKWLKEFVASQQIDLIISDNRPGLFHDKIPSIYISHQLSIETGFAFLNGIAQKIHYRMIRKFNACWVPDFENEPSLAGKLSHPKKLPSIPVHYLGILSRLENVGNAHPEKTLFLLSGPEPQRSILEKKILHQLPALNLSNALLVRGLPGVTEKIKHNINGLTVHNYLNAKELENEISAAKFIVCRSGYSSLMDLVKLNKKALLVPTPGQGEQEYLAKKLAAENLFFYQPQSKLNLKEGLKALEKLPVHTKFRYNPETLKGVIMKSVLVLTPLP